MSEMLLEIKGLTKIFRRPLFESFFMGNGKTNRDFYALDDVSLNLKKGEFIGLVGRTGCGKSTLARITVRLLQPDKGCVLYKGSNIQEMNSDRFDDFRQNVRLLFQDSSASLNPKMTVFRIVEEPLKLYTTMTKKECSKKVMELLNEVNLVNYEKRYAFELSGGEKRRVSLARGLATNPCLIIADEVTSGLDSLTKLQIMRILLNRNSKSNMAVLMISHDLRLVRRFCRRIAVMDKGRIVEILTGFQDDHIEPQHPFVKELIESILEIK